MRIILLIGLQILIAGLNAQENSDSLEKILKNTPHSRPAISVGIEKLQKLPLDDSQSIKTIFNWITENTTGTAMADLNANANLAMGRKYALATKYGEATKYLTVAQSIAENNNLPLILAQTYNILGSVYQNNDPSEKAIDFFKKSLDLSIKHNYTPGIIKARYNLGKLMFEAALKQHKKTGPALAEIKKAFEMAIAVEDTQSIINQSNGLAAIYSIKNLPDSSITYLNIADSLLTGTTDKSSLLTLYSNLATNYSKKRDYKKAITYLNEGLEIAKKVNAPRWMCTYYYGLAETYEKSGDYQKANYYNRLNIQMHNTLVSQENFIAAADIQNKYESVKKDNEILKLANVNRQKATMNNILLGSTIGLIVLGTMGYVYYRKNKQLNEQERYLQKQKLREMEKDRQLVAINSMFKGQEEERKRIARELHDGLGSLLSSTKHSFSTIREGLNLSPEYTTRYDKSLLLLDTTIVDLKKVAQNMMPEVLAKFGLKEAVLDFCISIQNITGTKIILQQLGSNRKLNDTAEIFTYRIIQELVNNAVKYAAATEIFVELLINEKAITISVEDDGKGFDYKIIQNASGSGLKNIRERVEYFNGSMELESTDGKGAAIYITMYA